MPPRKSWHCVNDILYTPQLLCGLTASLFHSTLCESCAVARSQECEADWRLILCLDTALLLT
jgi:hypothetical protein